MPEQFYLSPQRPSNQETILDIGVDLIGAQLLRWTVRLVEVGVPLKARPRRTEVVIDAHRGQAILVVEWR